MTNIAVTQRVDFIEKYNEKRDSLDQRWFSFLNKCGITPILLPNNPESTEAIFKNIQIDGILLTGGNDLVEFGGNTPERDIVEKKLIEKSIDENLPLIGVCRGMQMLLNYFSAPMVQVEGHVASKHKIQYRGSNRIVNSFHNFAAMNLPSELITEARSDDNVIEAIRHTEHSLYGIMWHPERNEPFEDADYQLFHDMFKSQ